MGFETPEEGYLAKILVPAGEKNIPLGKLLCIIVENQDDIAAFKDYVPTAEDQAVGKKPAAPKPTQSQTSVQPSPTTQQQQPQQTTVTSVRSPSPQTGGVRLFASPLAKSLAAAKGIDHDNHIDEAVHLFDPLNQVEN